MSNFSHGMRFPENITPALSAILSMSHSELLPLGQVFQAAGHQMPQRDVEVVALVRFQLVRLAVSYPEFLEPAPRNQTMAGERHDDVS